MFETLSNWIASITDESKLFEHADDEVLHSALASLLYHIISADRRHDGREKHEFDRLLKQELELSQEQADHLYQAAKSAKGDLHEDLHTINAHLKENPGVRLQFMRKLLQIINIHGAHSNELKLFYEALHEVFPDVKTADPGEAF